jgi:hypothetical protein
MGKKMVGEGGIYFLELLADAGFKTSSNTTDSSIDIKKNYGQAVALIYTMATLEFDPAENPFIREMQLRFGLIGFFLILMFILTGAINVNVYTITSAKNAERAWILSNRYHIPINEYAITLMEACILMLSSYVVLRITILLEVFLTKLIMLQILDRIEPTGANIVMYLMMSICYLIIGIALAYRILVIAMFHAGYVVFIGLYCFGMTREIALAAWWYYLKLLFLRTIIVGVTVVGVGVISYIGPIGGVVDPFSQMGQMVITLLVHPTLYAALIIILVIICLMSILGIKNVLRASKLVLRKATHGVYR